MTQPATQVLRYCFTPPIPDNDTDVGFIQETPGKKNIKTTLINMYVTTKTIDIIKSPMDHLSLADHT